MPITLGVAAQGTHPWQQQPPPSPPATAQGSCSQRGPDTAATGFAISSGISPLTSFPEQPAQHGDHILLPGQQTPGHGGSPRRWHSHTASPRWSSAHAAPRACAGARGSLWASPAAPTPMGSPCPTSWSQQPCWCQLHLQSPRMLPAQTQRPSHGIGWRKAPWLRLCQAHTRSRPGKGLPGAGALGIWALPRLLGAERCGVPHAGDKPRDPCSFAITPFSPPWCRRMTAPAQPPALPYPWLSTANAECGRDLLTPPVKGSSGPRTRGCCQSTRSADTRRCGAARLSHGCATLGQLSQETGALPSSVNAQHS